MKIKKSELQKVINEYLEEENDNLDYLVSEGFFRGVGLAGFITLILPDANTLARKGKSWKKAIRSIVSKAGSAQKAVDNAYDILNSGLIKNVIGLAKPGYIKQATKIAKGSGMSLKEYSKAYPPFDLKYIQKLIAYSKSTYPGILSNSVITKFRPVLKKLLKGLNPYILANDAVNAIFYGKPYPSITTPLPTIKKNTEVDQKSSSSLSDKAEPFVFGSQDDASVPDALKRDTFSSDSSKKKIKATSDEHEIKVDQNINKDNKPSKIMYRLPGDKTWEYKKLSGKWYTRKIGSKRFIDISNDKTAVNLLNKTARQTS